MKKVILFLLVPIVLGSCAQGSLTRTDLDNKQLSQVNNSLDPRGSGTIDPKGVTTTSEKGLIKFFFNKGENEITFKIKPSLGNMSVKAITDCNTANCLLNSPEMKNFKEVKGQIQVDDQIVEFKADVNTMLPDLSQALQLLGLAKNSQVTIKGTAYDINGASMGSKEFKKTITEKVDTVEIEILIGKIQDAAK